jgi:alkanesulfonate monooxygenase SsuD/methylene tetrahydromethanopterin reductase-like flavin-dependent oxidoreductase (luciferase family)
VKFNLDARPLRLTVFDGSTPGSLHVLFTDATSGVTTSPACGSLSVDAPGADGALTLDFNRAVNLPCAYTEFATCPLPPPENRLPVPIEAGEMIPDLLSERAVVPPPRIGELPVTADTPLHLAAALDGAGWHPAAWREPRARPAELFTARYWTDVIAEAEAGLLDFVTIEDGFSVQSSRADRVAGRLDAVLIAARAAPLTRHIGLVPTVIVTHTEPFHISKAIATLDYASNGRAGVRVRISASPDEAAHFGRRDFPRLNLRDRDDPAVRQLVISLFDEAADYVEVVRRLWDSWDDDAEIRDAATGRFVDRDKLHYIDFSGDYFSVKGPSITPRPPQGQPVVAALGHADVPYRLIGSAADIGFVTPGDADHARQIVAGIRAVSRAHDHVHVFADLAVFLGPTVEEAANRKARLDELAGYVYTSDATVFTGTPAQLAGLLLEWQRAGLSGFRLRPGVIPDDLEAITRVLVPELQVRGAFRTAYEASTLRGLLGLSRPVSRYATSGSN